MESKKTHRIPLYLVVSSLDDANTSEPVPYSSAASYRATLDSFGIPATIMFCKSITVQ